MAVAIKIMQNKAAANRACFVVWATWYLWLRVLFLWLFASTEMLIHRRDLAMALKQLHQTSSAWSEQSRVHCHVGECALETSFRITMSINIRPTFSQHKWILNILDAINMRSERSFFAACYQLHYAEYVQCRCCVWRTEWSFIIVMFESPARVLSTRRLHSTEPWQ